MLKLLFYLTCFSCISTFHQEDSRIIFDRVDTVFANTTMVDNIQVHFFTYNRTLQTKLLNFTVHLKVDLEDKLKVKVQAYKFASNEYRLFPISFTLNICQYCRKNLFGIRDMLEKANLSPCCSMKKGTYSVTNFEVDISKFPPGIPKGTYMNDLLLYIDKNVIIMRYHWYAKIEDVLHWS